MADFNNDSSNALNFATVSPDEATVILEPAQSAVPHQPIPANADAPHYAPPQPQPQPQPQPIENQPPVFVQPPAGAPAVNPYPAPPVPVNAIPADQPANGHFNASQGQPNMPVPNPNQPPVYPYGQPPYLASPPAMLQQKKSKASIWAIVIPITVLVLAIAAVLVIGLSNGGFIKNNLDYNKANHLYSEGNYSDAEDIFYQLGDYRDSQAMIVKCKYARACESFDSGDYYSAQALFDELGDYSDSSARLSESKYRYGIESYNSGSYDIAMDAFEELDGYSDSENYLAKSKYGKAIELYKAGNWNSASSMFSSLGSGYDSGNCGAYIVLCDYHDQRDSLSYDDFDALESLFDRLKSYSSNAECKAALGDGLFTVMKMCGYKYFDSSGNNGIEIEKTSEGAHSTSTGKFWSDSHSGYWRYERDLAKHGTFTHSKTTADDSFVKWFEVVEFSDSTAKHPKWMKVKLYYGETVYDYTLYKK